MQWLCFCKLFEEKNNEEQKHLRSNFMPQLTNFAPFSAKFYFVSVKSCVSEEHQFIDERSVIKSISKYVNA
jgi:hypothetical protein